MVFEQIQRRHCKWCQAYLHRHHRQNDSVFLKKKLQIIKLSQSTFPWSAHLEFSSSLRDFWSFFNLVQFQPPVSPNLIIFKINMRNTIPISWDWWFLEQDWNSALVKSEIWNYLNYLVQKRQFSIILLDAFKRIILGEYPSHFVHEFRMAKQVILMINWRNVFIYIIISSLSDLYLIFQWLYNEKFRNMTLDLEGVTDWISAVL